MRTLLAMMIGWGLLVGAIYGQETHPIVDGPLPPQRAHESFELEADLRVELVVGEPWVVAPVAMAFDARGRMFVVENRGYPTGPKEGEPPQGRVALLEDTNGDGQIDRRLEFADQLTFPNGILPWKDGVIVTCAPDILWLRDTNDDGREDQREVLFTGFATSGSTQLRVSHPTLAPDGWIYVANGLSGGSITSPKYPEAPPVELKANTFRFRPDFSGGEAAAGPAQFGLCFDDYNRMFVCYNRVQVQHVVFTPQQLARNPLGFSDMLHNCPAETVSEPLKGHGAAARLYPLSANITTADSHAGTFTAACGLTLVRGSGLPAQYEGGVLSCDPTGNLIHFDSLSPLGVTFSAVRLTGTTELLRSRDSWFRPVFLTFGPDGALYVCDMYRKTIEHPDYLPTEIRKHTDFESGREMGRIWKITSKDIKKPLDPRDSIESQFTNDCIKQLGSHNAWNRDTASRLLWQESDKADFVSVADYLSSDPPAFAQVRALYLLDAWEKLKDETLRKALRSSQAPVREVAVTIAGRRLVDDEKWMKDIAALHHDENPRVQFQTMLAMSLASKESKESGESITAMKRMLFAQHEDRWFRAASWNALADASPNVVRGIFQSGLEGVSPGRELLTEYGRLLAVTDTDGKALNVIDDLKLLNSENRLEIALGIAQGLSREQTETLQTLIARLLAEAKAKRPESLTAREVTALLELLGYATYDIAGSELRNSLESTDLSVQLPAIRSLGKLQDERALNDLLAEKRWELYPANVREEVVDVCMTSEVGIRGVLSAIESNAIEAHMVDAFRRGQLLQHANEGIRARAAKLFGQVQGDRAKVYDEYKSVAEEPGSAFNGRLVFKKNCANCHRLNREGTAVGPDLFGIRNQPKATILLHLLVPDHEITSGFTAYQVVTHDGRSFTGQLVGESEAGITLRLPQGKEETIAQVDIEEFSASKLSLMPQGLENTITRAEFADLLAYLKGEREVSPDSSK
jgi:putative membrane-bound dehydrogenase-like protein